MLSFSHVTPFRSILSVILLLGLLPASSLADSDSKRAKEQVEFGIDVARRGLWKEAMYRWVKATELDPSNASARNNLAVAYEQEGEFDLADQEYKRALELDPESVYIRQNYELFREAYEKRKRKERKENP